MDISRFLIIGLLFQAGSCIAFADPWKMHVIDGSLRGADGVRLADFNNDGLLDVVTGWEESGVVRMYLNPGAAKSSEPWPRVTVGKGKSPEDAVAMDVDGDGDLDIISCHEGKEQKILVHQNVGGSEDDQVLLAETNWKTAAFAQLPAQQWMFATEIELRGGQRAFIAGAKNKNATLTLFPRPINDADDLLTWQPHLLRQVGWVMSMAAMDMDSDGDKDLVFNDRKGPNRGVYWMEQPDSGALNDPWPEHVIGGLDHETLFIEATTDRVLASTRSSVWLDLQRDRSGDWKTTAHPNPIDVPMGKAIKQLSKNQLVMTANTQADRLKSLRPGLWIKQSEQAWKPIGAETKVKYDRIECIDLDGDGDLDLMTCEEKQNLGVIWYENPEN